MVRNEDAFRHIIDMDGQLAGLPNPVVDRATLLAFTGRIGRGLYLVHAGGRPPIGPEDLVQLREDGVAFFESCEMSRFASASPPS